MAKKDPIVVEVETAISILKAMSSTITSIENWWPPSKRGSNAQRHLDHLKEQRATALLCLSDALPDDDFSSDPVRWSMSKLIKEKPHGMPAVLAEWERRKK